MHPPFSAAQRAAKAAEKRVVLELEAGFDDVRQQLDY